MTTTPPQITGEQRGVFSRLYHGETDVDFVGRFRLWLTISLTIIGIGLVSLAFRGLNLGIDFEGGVVWEVPAGDASVTDVRDALEPVGLSDATIQTLESDDDTRIRVEHEPVDAETSNRAVDALAEVTGSDVDEVNRNEVGPSWGDEISRKALRALIIFLVVITIYISLRFEFKMAVPTLAALVHDILFTIGVYSIFGFEVTPATVIALLTILGFSIYDGIVVFDKVDENTKLVSSAGGVTYGAMVNLSLNQVLMRSLNTSITALLPVGSLLFVGSYLLGATTLAEFALALLVGLFAGAYSSIFIASPMLAMLKEREPRYRDLRRRVEARSGATAAAPAARPAAAGTVSDVVDDEAGPADAPPPLLAPSGRAIPPRPRKRKRR